MLVLDSLTVGFGAPEPAVADVSFRLAPGEAAVICGAGGAGKSTLLAAAGGIVPRLVRAQEFSGEIRLGGRLMREWPTPELFSAVGFVFQNLDDQLWNLSVEDMIAFPLENRRTPRDEVRREVSKVIDRFGIRRLAGRQALTLSGGERRMVALAAAFAAEPDLLVLDEPTTGLDPQARGRLASALGEARAARPGCTMLIAEQDAASLAQVTERALFLAGGRLVGQTSISDAARNNEIWRTAGVIAPGEALRRRRPGAVGPTRLAVSGLRSSLVRPGGAPVLQDVSFALSAGEIVGLVGANGAGKTTLFQTLLGLLKAAAGSVALDDADAASWSPAQRARRIGYLPQNMRRVLFNMTVLEEVVFAMATDTRRVADPVIRAEALAALEPYGLADKAEVNPFALSAREQGLLGLACVEAGGCAVAILDEPLIARDRAGRALLGRFLDASEAQGRAVILISHDLELVDDVCARAMVLADGRLAFDGPTGAVWDSGAFEALGWPKPYAQEARAA
ncbi:ABC transporter ATP-binding protein [Hansschlegelia quercus]|uniref:ABC transporter ATP-binding protein n=1 Tax=Hansschlegelia quercus TaxID=2528245 RepID=A0A4Q9GGA7_9HYPH|nr:ABC transporter ATP-binding protein [Hansschlegelia quercus]TBN52371.1 ABC transporter ATP-binding protein [Hansschlegelia quercus]